MPTTTSAAELLELAARFRRVAGRTGSAHAYDRGLAAGLRLAAEMLEADAAIAASAEETAARKRDVLLPTPGGAHAAIEADAIRALIGYVEQRDEGTAGRPA